MENQLKLNKQLNPLAVADAHHREVMVLQGGLEVGEEALEDHLIEVHLLHGGPHQWKEDHHLEVEDLLLKDRWEVHRHEREIVMDPLGGSLYLPEEMTMDLQEMTIILKKVIPAEIILVPESPGTIHIVSIAIIIPVMNMVMVPEDIVNVMGIVVMAAIVVTSFLIDRVEGLTEILMTVMVILVVHLPEGHHHHIVEAAVMMITILEMDTVAEIITKAAEVILTPVVEVIVLPDKKGDLPQQLTEVLLHGVLMAVQVVEHPEAEVVEAVAQPEEEAEADIKLKTLYAWTKTKWTSIPKLSGVRSDLIRK